ncbi:hypothetical protein ACE3MZ_15020 [Paenibacillus sp. WLX1005]|uniref:hypothetical protein n=1 Tax=Paenibacillus sp. WLX1005 TaxID=3243766 RepID=UPI003983F4BC
MAVWTSIENAKVIGILPDYRRLIKQNISKSDAQKICAQQLISNDALKIFEKRMNNVENPLRTLGQHIEVINQIAAGITTPKRADEYNWYNCFKY